MSGFRLKNIGVIAAIMLLPFFAFKLTPFLYSGEHFILMGTLIMLPYTLFLLVGYRALVDGQRRLFAISGFFAVCYTYLQVGRLPDFLETSVFERAQVLMVVMPLSLFFFFLARSIRRRGLRYFLESLSLAGPLLVFGSLAAESFPKLSSFPQWILELPALKLSAGGVILACLFLYRFPLVRGAFSRLYYAICCAGFIPLFYGLGHYGSANRSFDVLAADAAACFATVAILLGYAGLLASRLRGYVDTLTGIPNHFALSRRLKKLRRRYAIATLDVDSIRRIRRIYGLSEAVDVLRYVTRTLVKQPGIEVYRHPRQGIVIVATGKSEPQLAERLQSIRQQILKRDFFIRAPRFVRKKGSYRNRDPRRDPMESERLSLSISAGIAATQYKREDPLQVFYSAMVALHDAQKHGAGNIVMHSPPEEAL